MFGTIEWKSVNKSIDSPVQKWSHCIECVGWAWVWAEWNEVLSATDTEWWLGNEASSDPSSPQMDDRCWTDRRSLDPVVRDFLASFANEPCHNDVAWDCLQKWVRAEKRYRPGTTYTGEMEEGVKLQEVGRRHGTNCPGVLIELSKWVIKYRVSRIKIHRSNLDSRFLPCRKKVLILTIYQPLGAHPLNLLATKIVHLFPHL